jgi:hypothetical protein
MNRQVREGAAGDVSEHLLDDGVAAMLPFGLGQHERGVGEDRVTAPGGEQLARPGGLLVLVPDPADDQPGGDRRSLSWANAVYLVSPITAIAARTLAFIGTVTENRAPAG